MKSLLCQVKYLLSNFLCVFGLIFFGMYQRQGSGEERKLFFFLCIYNNTNILSLCIAFLDTKFLLVVIHDTPQV